MLFLLTFLVASLQAATLRIEAVNDSVMILVNGSIEGRTPLTLQLEDGRYGLEFKKEEWQVASIRYGLLVSGQTKGKMLVDWEGEEVKVVWAEDIVRAREEEAARKEAERRAAEEAKRREEERLRAAEEQKRIAAEEAKEAAEREVYMKHREVGVAAMKTGDRRTALRAFRASRAAGDDDARVRKLVAKLEGEVGTVRARVTGAKRDKEFEVVLTSSEAEPWSPDKEQSGRFVFEDVPADVPLELRVTGHGYDAAVVPIEPFGAGKRHDATAQLSWRGFATLILTDWPDTIRVRVIDTSGEHQPENPGEFEVTTGSVTLSMDGPTGARELQFELEEGTTQAVPIKEQMPGAVVIEGLPSGTTLRLDEGPEGVTLSKAGVDRDDVDKEQSGVGIADPLRLEGLLPGSYTVSIWHPVLGGAEMRFDPVPGDTTHRSLLWETLSNAPAVKAARQDWEQRLAASKQVPKATKLSLIGGGSTLAVASATTIFGIRALQARSDIDRITVSYQQALADDDGETANSLYHRLVDSQQTKRSARAITIGGLALTATGASISVALFAKGRKAKAKVEDWNLYALPGLPATPAPEPVQPTQPATTEE